MSYAFLCTCIILLCTVFGLRVDNYTKTCSCGWRNAPDSETRKSIYGGTEASTGEWPYAVLIHITFENGYTTCGGTIITKRHVLSAAHCYNKKQFKKVKIYYIVDRTDGLKNFKYAQKVYTNKKFKHIGDDISVLLTKKEFRFGKMIGPACFPSSRVPDGATVVALGWGLTGNTLPEKLQMVEMVTKNIHKCKDTNITLPSVNINSYICTETIGKSICQGDTGGPLLHHDRQSHKYFLVGITSGAIVEHGHKCPGKSNRFTDVSRYKNWVIDVIQRDTDLDLCTPL